MDDWISIGRNGSNSDCVETDLGDRSFAMELGKWYILRAEIIGSQIKVYINNILVLEAHDDELKRGKFELDVAPGSIIQYDDIRVLTWDD